MKNLKLLIKKIVPPIFIDIYTAILKKNINEYTFIGHFLSWDEAIKSNYRTSDYINNDLEEEKTQQFEMPERIIFDVKYSILPILISLENKIKNILEIGGGCNPIYSYIKKTTKINIKTTVIEKKSFVDKFSNKIPSKIKKSIRYLHNINLIKHKSHYDVIYFGSSLQYFADEKIILKILKFSPKYIIVSRTFFSQRKKNFFVLQNNIEKNLFPYKITSFINFTNLLKRNNFNLIYNADLLTNCKHENIKSEKLKLKDLIFKKI
jgi:putative methyltransferase (TIGR04325 family)